MELKDRTEYIYGDAGFDLSAGKNLKIETSPAGSELLNVTVPVGKTWTVVIDVRIIETDV